MFRFVYLIFTLPLYCILMVHEYNNTTIVVPILFVVLIFIQSFVMFKKKFNKFDYYVYVFCSLVLFPLCFFGFYRNISDVYFILVYFLSLGLFFTLFFFKISHEFSYFVLMVFTLIFGLNSLYINVKSNELVVFIFINFLNFTCFPDSKKFKIVKFNKKRTDKSISN